MYSKPIDAETLKRVEDLRLPRRAENNPYLVLSVYGDGRRAPDSWTVKVYRNAKGQLKLVTDDYDLLMRLIGGEKQGERKTIIKVDDSGWGFPLGGVMIGATDGSVVLTGLIDVQFFQGELFRSHAYLEEAANVSLGLVKRLGQGKAETAVEICPGYVNSRSREALLQAGYEVRVTEITGLLQNELEERFKEYVETLGYRDYFDPKETSDIKSGFDRVIGWIDRDPERLKLAKTGWKYFQKRGPGRTG